MDCIKKSGNTEANLAKTVSQVANLENEYAQLIIDRSNPIDEKLVNTLISQGIMSYAGRNPAPALDENGNFQCTDLDLLSFLVPLARRNAVIEIPSYSNRRQVTKRAGERKIGSNQFGPITSLVSNQEVFSFSVKLHDKTVVCKDPQSGVESIGGFRNYMIVDCDGHWYEGWDKIVWDPSKEENRFLSEKNLWTGNSIRFQYYLHPNRWQSVYGAPYLLKKMLIKRIDDEASFYRQEIKRLEDAGISLPVGVKEKSKCTVSEGKTCKISVETMEMKLDFPDFIGSYKPVASDQEGMVQAYRRQKLLTYTWRPAIQFIVRANEAAFMKYGLEKDDSPRIAHWMGDCEWSSYRKNSRSALYRRMILSDKMSLLYRTKTKTETVAA